MCVYFRFFVSRYSSSPKRQPATGETLPAFKLAVPENNQARSYLGLSGSGQFAVAEIETQVVIIEIFNMY